MSEKPQSATATNDIKLHCPAHITNITDSGPPFVVALSFSGRFVGNPETGLDYSPEVLIAEMTESPLFCVRTAHAQSGHKLRKQQI